MDTEAPHDGADDTLRAEQRRIERGGRLRWFHWAIILLSTGLTLLLWHTSRTVLEERAAQRFEVDTLQVIELFTERLATHADLLRASAGLLAASEHVTPDEWRQYTDSLALTDQFPGISGLGVIYRVSRRDAPAFVARQRADWPDYRLFPEHAEPLHLPLALVAPRALEGRLIGFDLAYEPYRRDAIRRAVRTDTVQITAPIDLANEGGTGFVMVAPFARNGGSGGTAPPADTRGGVTVASMSVLDLAIGARERDKREVLIRVSDDGRTMYDEHGTDRTGDTRASRRRALHTLSLYGREWLFDVRSTPAFHATFDSATPRLVLAGGLLIDGLLLVLFSSLSRANRHCLSFAARASARLRGKQAELEACNEELEAFAHVVSHDLKTPLGGVMHLAEFIEEDLADYANDPDAHARIETNVERLKTQALRGRALIDGVLEYSEVGTATSATEAVDVGALLGEIGDALTLHGGQLLSVGDLPVLETHRTPLEQVLTNLVGNAAKYHPDRDRLRVEISAVPLDERTVRFRVGDNGPGIEKRHHKRIFELFGTLGHAGDVDSTGVGLSIVKKTVERLGGGISIESSLGRGATFVFDWPVYPASLDAAPKAA